MENFLFSTKKLLTDISQGLSTVAVKEHNLHIVMGNQAADLDSVVSSLVYAYFLQNVQEVENCHVVPILNCARKDFVLHTDVVFTLDEVSVNKDGLVFINDLDLQVLKDRGVLRALTLVDHNVLAPDQEFMSDIIVNIIDHHQDEQQYIEQNKKTIEPVGSCCTLVAEQVLKGMPSLLTAQISKLLLTTILLDTCNLPDVEQRSTNKDNLIIKHLSKGMSKDSLELYKSVGKAKFDNSRLGSYDLLRRDFKCLTNDLMSVGISSVTSHINDLTSRPNFEQDAALFCQETSLIALIIMCIEVTPESSATRQLGIWSQNASRLADHIAKHLSDHKELKLEPMKLPNCSVMKCFQQGNVSASRKIISPILKKIISMFS